MIKALGDLAKCWIMPLVLAIGALAASVLLVNAALSAYKAIQTAIKIATAISTAAQWLNAAMSANPYRANRIIILHCGALVAAFVILWNTKRGIPQFLYQYVESDSLIFHRAMVGIQGCNQFILRLAEIYRIQCDRLVWAIPGPPP